MSHPLSWKPRLPPVSPNLVVALVLLIASIGFGAASLHLGLWNYGMPGVGLTSLLASAGMLPISIVLLWNINREDDDGPIEGMPLAVAGMFVLYGIGMSRIGMVVPTFLFVFLWAWWIYARPWMQALAAAAIMTLCVYLLFSLVLHIPM